MHVRRLSVIPALLLAVLSPLSAPASPGIDAVLNAGYALHDLGSVALAPDGSRVAYIDTVRNIGSATDPTPHGSIEIAPIDGGTPIRLTAGDGKHFFNEANPVWSPNGTQIAFLSDAQTPGQVQIFVAGRDASNVRRVSHLIGDVQTLRWSPDGKQLAFLYIPNAQGRSGPLAPAARQVGVIGSSIEEQRLTVIDPASGTFHLLSPSNVYVYEYSWAPDGRAFALTYAHGDGDNNWWIAQLARLDAASGTLTTIYRPHAQIAYPSWSPDGRSIAFIEGLMSDEGSTGGDVFSIAPGGGTPRALTPNFNGSAAGIEWHDAHTLLLSYHRAGSLRLAMLDTATHALVPISHDDNANVYSAHMSGNGRVAYLKQSFTKPSELFAGSLTTAKAITALNASAPVYWGNATSVTWTSDGYHVQGWLIAPQHVESGKRYPMVVIVHGGPAAENTATFPTRQTAAVASQDYYVFLPNPRGSYGQGERFTRANVKDFGYGDTRDILRGVTAATHVAPIDPQRVGIYGWSYGGYMTMWAVTNTNRFKAAVAGAGVSNWQSYYGENGIDQWMIPYFGASVYDDPQVYARSSPMTFIKNVKTPTLVLVGERDTEVPAPQSFEFWHALKTLNVPTQLVVYANEGHGVGKPADQRDIARRLVAWFNHYLK